MLIENFHLSTDTGSQQNDRAEPRETDNSTTQQLPPTSAQGQGQASSSVPSEGTQLRSRLHTTAASTRKSSGGSSRDNSGHTGSQATESEWLNQQQEEPEEGEGGEDDALITIRLIMYGSTTKLVRVSPTTKLADMRRYREIIITVSYDRPPISTTLYYLRINAILLCTEHVQH